MKVESVVKRKTERIAQSLHKDPTLCISFHHPHHHPFYSPPAPPTH